MKILLQIVSASILVSLISFIGIIFFGLKLDIRKITSYLISLASGTLLGGAFLDLIPESLAVSGADCLKWIAAGVFFFFALEKFLIWRHCHIHQRPEDHMKPEVGAKMVLIGDAVHNFIDGVIIASAFTAGTAMGISITIAIILHEIPQELGDYGILIHGGYTMKEALLLNALTATTSLVGALVAFVFLQASTMVNIYVLPFAAGGLLYIALADLIPQLHDEVAPRPALLQILLLTGGFGIMMAIRHRHG